MFSEIHISVNLTDFINVGFIPDETSKKGKKRVQEYRLFFDRVAETMSTYPQYVATIISTSHNHIVKFVR